MRILVFSDSHGRLAEMRSVVKNEARFDMLLHAGDYGDDLARLVMEEGFKVPFYAVRGNCDYDSECARQEMVEVNGIKIFLTHGNRQGVKTGINRLYYYALEQGADMVVFGHTHRPLVKNTGELYVLNPGTIAMPHGYGKSYGIIEIDENPHRRIDIKTVVLGR
ncbi:MAG: metallophosphoesterase [Eubacteriales bacterium]